MKDSDAILKIVLSAYLGEKCQGCGQRFETIDSLKDSVWWPWDEGRIGHKECFELHQKRTEKGTK